MDDLPSPLPSRQRVRGPRQRRGRSLSREQSKPCVFEPLFGSLFLYSPFLLRLLPLGSHSSTPSFLASSKSLRCYGFKKQKSPLESIRRVAVLVCECAELFCSKIRKSICLLSQGNKQLYMPSKISNETSCIELISSFPPSGP